MSRRVEFSPEAVGDLIDLYDYIAGRDGPDRAIGYIERIEDFCRSLALFPDRAAPGATTCVPDCGFSGSNAAP